MRGYKTSKDYKRLKELLDNGYEVVCFTTYDFRQYDREPHEPLMTTDICSAKFVKSETNNIYDMYIIGVRGHIFIQYWPNGNMHDYSFEDICKADNIEFIEPEEETDSHV